MFGFTKARFLILSANKRKCIITSDKRFAFVCSVAKQLIICVRNNVSAPSVISNILILIFTDRYGRTKHTHLRRWTCYLYTWALTVFPYLTSLWISPHSIFLCTNVSYSLISFYPLLSKYILQYIYMFKLISKLRGLAFYLIFWEGLFLIIRYCFLGEWK